MARRPRLVTLTTDLGSAYAAQMKAVLYRSIPPGHVVDITHDLAAHRIPEAAFLLEHIAPGFPAGTVHVAVVDPGVGAARAPLVVRCSDGSYLVGPDNGLLWPLAERLGLRDSFRLVPSRVTPGVSPSATFEGRDLFAPAAAQLALGRAPERIGTPAPLQRVELARAKRRGREITGEIVHVDRFGNAITNIPSTWLRDGRTVHLTAGRRTVVLRRVRTYADLEPSRAGLIGSSFGTLEWAVREGSAASAWSLSVGEGLRLRTRARAGVRSPRPRGRASRAGKTVNIARRR